MSKIAFWTYDDWAFGSIHKALVKEFYKRGIYADLIPWQTKYSVEEKKAIAGTYDIFVSSPGIAYKHLINDWGVDSKKIVLIAHGEYDICEAIKHNNDMSSIKGYGVIARRLVVYSRLKGITAPIKLLQNGIMFDVFHQDPPNTLGTIGYAGALEWTSHYDNVKDLKRGYLASQIAQLTNTKILVPGKRYHMAMPGFYRDVDSVIMTSDEHEACGLPIMEAAASGRLPIAARVGINSDMQNPTGIILPTDEDGFVKEGVEIINELKGNPEMFRKKCFEAQDFAREYYDWSKVIDPWIDLITGP